MPITLAVEEEILVGREVVIEGPAPSGRYVTIFEDDDQTGYFYALDTQATENQIQDAVHIYNVAPNLRALRSDGPWTARSPFFSSMTIHAPCLTSAPVSESVGLDFHLAGLMVSGPAADMIGVIRSLIFLNSDVHGQN